MRSTRGLILIALLAGLPSCGPDEPATAEAVALELFVLARQEEPDGERVDALFGPIDGERERAELLDAMGLLRTEGSPVILDSYTLDERLGFDLEARLPSDGAARYSVLVDITSPPGEIVWFNGPGVEWPERGRDGTGLSTSSPPAVPGGG